MVYLRWIAIYKDEYNSGYLETTVFENDDGNCAAIKKKNRQVKYDKPWQKGFFARCITKVNELEVVITYFADETIIIYA